MAHRAATIAAALFIFVLSWFLRFNDPGGSFAGLTDDHFFYLVRGWQILFGEFPVRDFVDHGAPLYFYVAAAVQLVLGRGTWSEVVFSVTVLSACAAGLVWVSARASKSVLLALLAVGFHLLLEPRFYNYPKVLVYVVAIPALWAFADRPAARQRFVLALVTAVAFLFRHDHGFFVAIGFGALLMLLGELTWRDRLRHAILYGVTVLALLAPYLLFIEFHGGVGDYLRHASAWAERDRLRAPWVWPTLEPPRLVALIFYLLLAIPLVAFAVLAVARDAGRPDWPHAGPKIAVVAVLGIVLNVFFLRAPLEGRLADPSVPHAILLAWLFGTAGRLLANTDYVRPRLRPLRVPIRIAVCLALVPITGGVIVLADSGLYRKLDKAALASRPGKAFERADQISTSLRRTWPLERWTDRDEPNVMRLAFYLRDCTNPDDRVFMNLYLPQVLALARRGFAGGHADLRRGFFNTVEEQRLTIERVKRQSVPVVVMGAGEYAGFRESFPLITRYFDERYEEAGDRALDERFSVKLLVDKQRQPTGRYEPLDWPCFR